MKIVVDSYAWIEIFLGSSKGDKARKALEEADHVFTPDSVLAEVARKYLRERVTEETIIERLSAISEASEIINIEGNMALDAGKAFVELEKRAKEKRLEKPSLFDGIVLSVARSRGAKVITGDQHFKDLEETIWLGD